MELKLLLSVLPPLTAIVLALFTKQVIPSLILGLWVGGFIIAPGLLSSISTTTEYITNTLSDQGNLDVLLFLYTFSGFVAIIELTGGVQGFAKSIEKIIKTKKGTLAAIWALVPITFVDCGFRVVATGSIMKPIVQKHKVSWEKFAFMLNNSSSPVVALIPIATTFVGYMVGVVASGLRTADITASSYIIYLRSIPFNFFSIASLGVILYSVITGFDFKVMRSLEKNIPMNQDTIDDRNMEMTGEPDYQDQLTVDKNMGFAFDMETSEEFENNHMDSHKNHKRNSHMPHEGMNMDHEMNEIDMNIEPRPWNLIIPIIILIPLSFYLMWWTGKGDNKTLLRAFSDANSSRSMLLALIITIGISVIFYRFQGIHINKMVSRFIKGGNRLMMTIAILAVAWPIAQISKDLGLPKLITSTIGDKLPTFLVPVVIFALTSLTTFFIGSSWGTWALIMPLAIPLASVSGTSIPLAVGAVFAGGTFGDVASPLSGMGAMASGIAEVEHMDYISAQMPYNITAAILAAVGFLIAGILI